jgi:hypothetical protein
MSKDLNISLCKNMFSRLPWMPDYFNVSIDMKVKCDFVHLILKVADADAS